MTSSDFSGKRILVLGASGFIGRHLCKRLEQGGGEIRAFARHFEIDFRENSSLTIFEGDIRDHALLGLALERVDIVFHLVNSGTPQSSNLDRVGDVLTNLVPTLEFLDLAVAAEVKKVVYISSGGTVYGSPSFFPTSELAPTEPHSSYGIVKLAIEKYLQLYRRYWNLEFAVIRAANPYGPGQTGARNQGFIGSALLAHEQARPIEVWGDGSVVRDFVFIDDLIDLIMLAALSSEPDLIINGGGGRGFSLLEILSECTNLLGTDMDVKFFPSRKVDAPNSTLDISKAKSILGWEPKTAIGPGLQATIDWMQQEIKKA